LDWIVMKCLEKDRGRRYETAAALSRDVQRYLADEPVEARPPSARYRARKFVRRNRGRVVAAALVLLVLVAGVVGTTTGLIEARGQRDAAREARAQADADREYAQGEFRRAEQEAGRAREAEAEQGRARQQVEAALARSDGLRLGSEAAIARPTDPGLALLLGLEAVRRYPHHLTYAALYDAAADLREQRTLRPGTSEVAGVRLSPDGARAVVYHSGYSGESVGVIDVATGKRLATWDGAPRGAMDVAWSPDGARAVTLAAGRVTVVFTDGHKPEQAIFTERVAYVWDPATGRELVHLRRHDDKVASAAFSPDGRKIVTASWDGTARIWDAVGGKELHVLKGHTNALLTARFSPDGRRVLTVCSQQEQKAYEQDVAMGPAAVEIDPGVTTRPYRVQGTSSGMSGGTPRRPDPAFARLWDADTGKQVGELALDQQSGWRFGNPIRPRVAAYSPDGGRVAVGFDGDLVGVWDAAGGPARFLFTEPIGRVSALAFSPDGAELAATGDGGAVVLWDVRTGQRERRLEGHGNHTVTAVEFSALGRRLVTAGADRTARVWEVRTGKELAVFRGHTGPVVAAHFLDQDTVLTAGDNTFRTWSVVPPSPVSVPLSEPDPPGGRLGKWLGSAPARHRSSVTALAFAPDGQSVFTGSDDRTVRQWDVATGRQRAQLPGDLRGRAHDLQFGSGGVAYVGTAALNPYWDTVRNPETDLSTIHRWDPVAGRAVRFLKGQKEAVAHLELSPDGRRLLVLRGETELEYQPESGRFGLRTKHSDKPGPLVTVWDTATGERLWASPPADGYRDVMHPRFSPDGRAVLYRTERWDELALYDAGTGARVRTLATPAGTRRVTTAQGPRGPAWEEAKFSPDGRTVVGQAATEPELWFWDAATGDILGSFRIPRPAGSWQAPMAFTPDSRRLAVVSDRVVHVVDVATRTGVQVLHGHEARVTALAVSPDGARLLTGSDDKTAALWDLGAGRLLTVYRGHTGAVDLVAFSPDGTRVATASPAETFARVWPVDVVPGFEKRKPRELTPAERVRYELSAASPK
jgi:WD40 repeat protein